MVSHEIYQPYAGNANDYFPLASLIKKTKQNKTKQKRAIFQVKTCNILNIHASLVNEKKSMP